MCGGIFHYRILGDLIVKVLQHLVPELHGRLVRHDLRCRICCLMATAITANSCLVICRPPPCHICKLSYFGRSLPSSISSCSTLVLHFGKPRIDKSLDSGCGLTLFGIRLAPAFIALSSCNTSTAGYSASQLMTSVDVIPNSCPVSEAM